MQTKANTRSKLYVAASMAVWGTLGPFTQQIAVSSGELALYRACLASGLIVIYLTLTKQKMDFQAVKKEILLLLLSGVAMGINWVLLFQAYRYTTISAATLSYYFAPVIVTLACPFLFKEKLTKKQILCFVMSTLGLVLIIGVGSLDSTGTHLIGILYGLGAAFLYATVVLMNKFIRNVAGIHRTLMQFCGAIAVLVPYVLITGGTHLEALDSTGWICLLIVGLVHTGITYCLYFSALKDLSGQEASILSYIDPLVAIFVSFFLLGESMTPSQMLGGALILGFTLWNEKP